MSPIGCYYKTWKRWTTNSIVEPKRRLSFIDDWRRCCCSWLKWRRGGAISVFMASNGGVLRKRVHYFSLCGTWTNSASTRGCANIPFPLLKFSTCSSRSSIATSHLMLSISFWQSVSHQPLSSFSIFFQSSIVDLEWGNQLFIPVHAWQMYEHVIYMMNSPFEGWHMVVTLVWWNKNRDSCPNSIMKIF
jgi:hypothetical protein